MPFCVNYSTIVCLFNIFFILSQNSKPLYVSTVKILLRTLTL